MVQHKVAIISMMQICYNLYWFILESTRTRAFKFWVWKEWDCCELNYFCFDGLLRMYRYSFLEFGWGFKGGDSNLISTTFFLSTQDVHTAPELTFSNDWQFRCPSTWLHMIKHDCCYNKPSPSPIAPSPGSQLSTESIQLLRTPSSSIWDLNYALNSNGHIQG